MTALLSYSLTTLANTKESLGIASGTTTDDELLKRLINSATQTIERYLGGRRLASTAYTNERYDGTGTDKLKLRNWPVTAITDVQYMTGDYGTPKWESFDSDFYIVDTADGQNAGVIRYSAGSFNAGVENIQVSYTAGYTTIPFDIEEACIQIVSTMYKQRKARGIKSESLGDRSVTYFENKAGSIIENLGLDDVLDQYRDFNF